MRLLVGLGVVGLVDGELLWPPSQSGAAETWGDFGTEWSFRALLAAHQVDGGRTVSRRAQGGLSADRLLVFLPGTYNIPQQYSTVLKYAADAGFDTIGLDYAWGLAPDSKRSLQCQKTSDCQACQANYHDLIMTGQGESLTTGLWPVFGKEQTDTLKWTHFFSTEVQFIPSAIMPAGVDLAGPLQAKASDYLDGMGEFAIEPLLTAVLKQLGWSEYLGPNNDAPAWSKTVIAGHSQGASHAAYIAYSRPVWGAMVFSGPQDSCGDNGLPWFAAPALGGEVIACYAEDEGGRPAIERNSAFFTEVHTFNATGKPRNYGSASWCPSPEHCASAVDDQLVEDVVEHCLPKLRKFVAEGNEPTTRRGEPTSGGKGPATSAVVMLVLLVALFDSR